MRTIFETVRLVLREETLDDLDFMAVMTADPEVMRYYPNCYSRAEAEAWIRRNLDRYAKDGHGQWLVLDKATGEPVGQVGLAMQNVERVEEPEIGYMIHRPFWRRGYASEAAAATRDYAFQTLGKKHVISLIRPVNLPSQGVARKIGMKPRERHVEFRGYEHIVFEIPNNAIT